MRKLLNKILCFLDFHKWLYCSEKPIAGVWSRECRRCGKRMTGSYDISYGDTIWKKGW